MCPRYKNIFLIFLTFLGIGLLPVKFSLAQVQNLVEKGDKIANEQIPLSGPWKFHYGDFLSVSEMQKVKGKEVSLPYTWTGKDYRGKKLGYSGYATYYTRIILPYSSTNWGLFMPVNFTNYRIFINGSKVGEVGRISDNANEALPEYDPKIYKIPERKDTLDIILHISNYHYRKGGQWRTPKLGKITTLIRAESNRIHLDAFLIGAILIMGLYHLGANFPLFKNKESFYFALLCLGTVLRLVCDGDYIITKIFPDLPFQAVIKIEFAGFYLAACMFVGFYQNAFRNYKQPNLLLNFFFWSFLGMGLFSLFAPVFYASFLIPVGLILTFAGLLVIIYSAFPQALKGDPELILFLIGITAICFAVINYFFNILGVNYMDAINSISVFLFFLCASIIISRRFNNVFLKVQSLSHELTEVNSKLESKVNQRTAELDQKNQELHKNNKELEKINNEKDNLMHVVAHDLKSPLSRSIGLIEVVENEGNLNDTQKQMLGIMKHNNEQGITIINDVLRKYAPNNQPRNNYAPFAVAPLVNNLLESYKETLNKKAIELNARIPDKGSYFTSDEIAISRILENLFSNAVKFTPQGRQVGLDVEIKENRLIITCSDEGPGISKEDQKLLFKKYQKLSARPTGGETSTGLGLSIVKQLVDKLDAKIEMASEEGKGTIFIVTIPAAAAVEESSLN